MQLRNNFFKPNEQKFKVLDFAWPLYGAPCVKLRIIKFCIIFLVKLRASFFWLNYVVLTVHCALIGLAETFKLLVK